MDLKYYDIPNTVANAVAAASRQKVQMLTLHISGGQQMIKAAADALKETKEAERPLLIGVTVLTSQNINANKVLELAREGIAACLDGVVCSAQEAALLRQKIKKQFVIITPGIRPNGSAADDQKRTATVRDAVKAGSDFLVIGRPILKAVDPVAETERFLGELNGTGN